ncbi:MAG: hypothetical protein WBR18_15500 [Anaerolineales bacterium]
MLGTTELLILGGIIMVALVGSIAILAAAVSLRTSVRELEHRVDALEGKPEKDRSG